MSKSKIRQSSSALSDGRQFGQYVRTERLTRGYALADLARKLNVTKGYLSRLEQGKAKPSATMIERIATTLNIDPTPLFVLAGYVPTDVKQILCRHPIEAPTMLRETFGQYRTDGAPVEKPMVNLASPARASKSTPASSGWESLYEIVLADCFDWLEQRAPNSIHAVVTDPP